MIKLIRGIVDFRNNTLPGYREKFAQLALEHKPDALMIACSDSRVVPNLFASSDPGDLFVVRNVGNLVPPCPCYTETVDDKSEGAAIEFAVEALGVKDIIVCGHSECGAMRAVFGGRDKVESPHLRDWLAYGEPALHTLLSGTGLCQGLEPHNRLSQLNVLHQIEHLQTYSAVHKRIQDGTLGLHGWWFDIAKAEVRTFKPELGTFVAIDEVEAENIISQLSRFNEKYSSVLGTGDLCCGKSGVEGSI